LGASQEPDAAALNLSAEEPPSLGPAVLFHTLGGYSLGRGRRVVCRALQKAAEIHMLRIFCLLFMA